MGTMIYIEDKVTFLNEIHRVLGKNSKFCLIERNKLSPFHVFLSILGIRGAIGEYKNFPTIYELKNLLSKNFEALNITGDYFTFLGRMKRPIIEKISKKIARIMPIFSYFLIINARKV